MCHCFKTGKKETGVFWVCSSFRGFFEEFTNTANTIMRNNVTGNPELCCQGGTISSQKKSKMVIFVIKNRRHIFSGKEELKMGVCGFPFLS